MNKARNPSVLNRDREGLKLQPGDDQRAAGRCIQPVMEGQVDRGLPAPDRWGQGTFRVIFLRAMAWQLDTRFRLIGLLPLTFFLAQAIHYWRVGGMGNLLWMCNVGNLLLSVGLFLNHRELIRAAAIWTIPGLGIWARYASQLPATHRETQSAFFRGTVPSNPGGGRIGSVALPRSVSRMC